MKWARAFRQALTGSRANPVLAAGLLVAGLAPRTAVATVEIGPFGTDVSPTEIMIVLDSAQAAANVTAQLAAAGFTQVEPIVGVEPNQSNYRLVKGSSFSPETKAALLAVAGVEAVRPVYQLPGSKDVVLSNGQVIVRFQPGTPRDRVKEFAAKYSCTIDREIQGLPQRYVLDADETAQTASVAAQRFELEPDVIYSHPSLLFHLQRDQVGSGINDPLYPFQWHLNNTGQLESAVPDADIDAPEAWDITLGQGAVVGVIDDSIQHEHEDLVDNYLTGFDFVDQDDDPSPRYGPFPFDTRGNFHGTNVSGIICAAANSVGVRGVAPLAQLVGCKIGFGILFTSDQDIADAFVFAEANGAMAINNSWSFGGSFLPVIPTNTIFLPDVISDAINEIAINGRGGLGTVVLFSSGNASLPISYGNIYASLPRTLAIGASLRNDLLTCYSNFGAEQTVVAPGGGANVPRDFFGVGLVDTCFQADITTTDNMEAPGVFPFDFDFDGLPDPGWPLRGVNPAMKFLDVLFPLLPTDPFNIPLVPDPSAEPDFENQDYTQRFSGTSAACPVASGVAALVLSVDPGLRVREVRNIIEHTADKVTTPNERFDPVSGFNERYGHGRVNAYRAVLAAQAGQTWPSPVENIQNVSSQALVRLFWEYPDWDDDGVPDEEIRATLVVRGTKGRLDWAPTDTVGYLVGQEVAPGVTVVGNDFITSIDQTGLPTGDFEFAIFTRTSANFYSWGRRTNFSAQSPIGEPLASARATPNAGAAPLTVSFYGGSVEGGAGASFRWSFGDGATGDGPAVQHTYTEDGTYIATLTVTTGSGETATATVQINVLGEANETPTATIIASPTTGAVPLIVLFQASATDADGIVLQYAWNFGDGTTSSGQTVEHLYLTPGTFAVTLTVVDDRGGAGTATQLIVVTGEQTTTTASETAPPGILESAGCGGGAGGAALMSAALLLTFGMTRRRR